MKERPILFSGEMVRAILDGRKTQTRRVIKPQPKKAMIYAACDSIWITKGETFLPSQPKWIAPYGQTGDRLWVRETWGIDPNDWFPNPSPSAIGFMLNKIQYRADWKDEPYHWGWHPSIFMPRWASRITLEITDVRVERLQDISEDDCWHEGIRLGGTVTFTAGYKILFRDLWDKLNNKRGYSWKSNPWVWVIEFKRLEQS